MPRLSRCLSCPLAFAVAGVLSLQTVAVAGHKRFGDAPGPAQALVSGSSLSYDGVDWQEVAEVLGLSIESWPVAGSSPAEWEQLQRRSPKATTTFVGVSLYDLNESWLSEAMAVTASAYRRWSTLEMESAMLSISLSMR